MSFIEMQVTDGVATLTLNRPQAGNALNWALLEQLRAALRQTIDRPEVVGIVIAATGGKFVSGADLGFFVRCLQSDKLSGVIDSTRASQEVFSLIAESPKPVVAAVQGAAVGGGVELALACHSIVATPRASFSLPETGLGILPASGGTYRLPRRVGIELAKWLVFTGHVLPPPKAVAIGLVDQLVMPDELLATADALARAPKSGGKPSTANLPPDAAALRAYFGSGTLAALCDAGSPEDRVLSGAWKAMTSKPRAALEWAERLIDGALAISPAAGAEAALAAASTRFGHPEVQAALAAAAAQQHPS